MASLTSLSLLPFCSPVDSELTSLCQSVLEDFNLCLFYLPSSPSLSLASEGEEDYESGYAFLPDLLIFQMIIICLMGVHSLKRAGNSLCPASCPRILGSSLPFLQPFLCELPPTKSAYTICVTAGLLMNEQRQQHISAPPPACSRSMLATTQADRGIRIVS